MRGRCSHLTMRRGWSELARKAINGGLVCPGDGGSRWGRIGQEERGNQIERIRPDRRDPVVLASRGEIYGQVLATKASVRLLRGGSGVIEVPFRNHEDFERVFHLITGREASEVRVMTGPPHADYCCARPRARAGPSRSRTGACALLCGLALGFGSGRWRNSIYDCDVGVHGLASFAHVVELEAEVALDACGSRTDSRTYFTRSVPSKASVF